MMAPAAYAAAGLPNLVGRPLADSGPLRGDGPGLLPTSNLAVSLI